MPRDQRTGRARDAPASPSGPRLRILFLCDDDLNHASTVLDHRAAIRDLSDHDVVEISPLGWLWPMPDMSRFDVIILHYSLVIIEDSYLPPAMARMVRDFKGLKAVFIQDEYRHIDRTVERIVELGVDVLFTCVPESSVEAIYGRLRRHGVRIVSTLTGFIPDELLRRPVRPLAERPYDVVYRGRPCPFWLGALAQEKTTIAKKFIEQAPQIGLTADVDWREERRVYGERWLDVMSSGRASLGVESGASIADFTGEVARKVEAFLAQQPDASFETVSREVLLPYEGNAVIRVISPRIFEAICLRTALVLFPGTYSGILKPGRHYIPLERDFSNLLEVAMTIRDLRLLETLTTTAFEEIAADGRYSYRTFAREVDRIIAAEWASKAATSTIAAAASGTRREPGAGLPPAPHDAGSRTELHELRRRVRQETTESLRARLQSTAVLLARKIASIIREPRTIRRLVSRYWGNGRRAFGWSSQPPPALDGRSDAKAEAREPSAPPIP